MKNSLIIAVIVLAVVVVAVGATSFSSNANRPSASRRSNLVSLDQLVGQSLPNITLNDKTGAPYDLFRLSGKNVVLFFSEGLMCYPACWNQMAAFGTDPRFNSTNTMAISVIADSPTNWERAATRMPDLAKATVLFDDNADAARKLDLLSVASSMHGGKFPGHTYVIIDKEGVVRQVLDDITMSVNNDELVELITKLY